MRTLNSLQTNASYLAEVKRRRGDLQTQLETMKLYLARSGLQVTWAGPVTTPPFPLSVSPVAKLRTLSFCSRWRTWTS